MADFEITYVVDEGRTDLGAFSALDPTILRNKRVVQRAALDGRRALWIAPRKEGLWWLAETIAELAQPPRHLLLALEVFSPKSLVVLPTLFARTVCSPPVRLLPRAELSEVVAWDGRADMCIGGVVEPRAGTVTLYRGDLRPITVPASRFQSTVKGVTSDLSRFEVTHYGQVLRFGNYGVSFEEVLFEYDADFRRAKKAQQISQDETFGGSVRRLRKELGLSRSAFAGVSERTIARIERGEVKRPHGRTLYIIADTLGVDPDELGQH